MKKINKVFSVILLVLLMFIFFAMIVFFQDGVSLPFYFEPVEYYPIIGAYFPMIFFWLSVILFVICLIFLLVIIFYPKEITTLKLKDNHGKLTLDKKAIKGFIQATLQKEDFIDAPKVKVKMTKKKIKVKIIGDLKRTSALYERNDLLINEMKLQLKELLGVQQQVVVNVTYSGYKKNEKGSQRVV